MIATLNMLAETMVVHDSGGNSISARAVIWMVLFILWACGVGGTYWEPRIGWGRDILLGMVGYAVFFGHGTL